MTSPSGALDIFHALYEHYPRVDQVWKSVGVSMQNGHESDIFARYPTFASDVERCVGKESFSSEDNYIKIIKRVRVTSRTI